MILVYIFKLECLSSGQGTRVVSSFVWICIRLFWSEDSYTIGQGVLKEGKEEAVICGRNPDQFVLNILQFDGVETKNGVKYTPGGVMRISTWTYLHLPPNGRLQYTLAMFECVAIPVRHDRYQNNAMRFRIR